MSSFHPSDQDFKTALALYFETSSESGLGDLFLAALKENDDLQKQIASLIGKAIANMGRVWAVEFLRDHPELLAPRKINPENRNKKQA